jgi:hypothetical protein
MQRLGPLEGRVATNNGTASLTDLVVIVVLAFVLLTGLDFLGAGHHSAPSTGASTVPRISHVASPPSLAAGAARR